MDVEIYNCRDLERLPLDMLTEVPKMQSLNVAMNYSISAEQLKSDWEAIIDGESGDEIQILYLSFNNLKETPSHDYMKRMAKMSYLDCTSNQIEVVHALGKEISPASVLLDYNKIHTITLGEDGYFCGLSMLETFSCSNNCLTKLPDLFSARSIYTMLTANFSSNDISELENGEQWRGLNTETLNLADNRLTTIPTRIMDSGSIVNVLMLSSNGIRTIEEGALIGPRSNALTTIDLSFNRITELPKEDFSNTNIPYLYGIDLSSNALSEFPRGLLDIEPLTVVSIRQQRDDEGNRTLSDWPTGIGRHPSMAALYYGSNDLGVVDDYISPYILLFEIKDNPNISIDVSSVCSFIELGYYELIYDSTQNIRGCDALKLD
jgi:Leucine-rich repeat (LRR) protein